MDAAPLNESDRDFGNLFANALKALDLLRQSGKPGLGVAEFM